MVLGHMSKSRFGEGEMRKGGRKLGQEKDQALV